MNWNAPVDIYCERLGTEFWAEPLNALSNAAFIIAALVGLYFARKHSRLTPSNILLIFLAFCVGAGSFLFHTFANEWSELADQIPIGLLVLTYITLSLRKYLSMTWPRTFLVMFIYFALSAALIYVLGTGAIVDLSWTKGSHLYAPVVLGFIALGLALNATNHPVSPFIWTAGGVFAIALSFRSMDASICGTIPTGTHFLWHTFNGVLIGIVLVAMMLYGEKQGDNA